MWKEHRLVYARGMCHQPVEGGMQSIQKRFIAKKMEFFQLIGARRLNGEDSHVHNAYCVLLNARL